MPGSVLLDEIVVGAIVAAAFVILFVVPTRCAHPTGPRPFRGCQEKVRTDGTGGPALGPRRESISALPHSGRRA